MKIIIAGITAILMSNLTMASSDEIKMSEKITESTVMLYYENLDGPRKFYRDLLGLKATYDDVWVSIYSLTPSSAVGLVQEGGTAYHKAKKDNAVMLSITTEDVDEWYEKVRSAGDIKILKEIYNHEKAPIRAFLVEDPGGYTVEFFQWLK